MSRVEVLLLNSDSQPLYMYSPLRPPFITGWCFLADLDDNSNISDGYVGGGGGDVDKPAEAGGRQDAALDSVGSATASASPSEMENILRNVIDLTQKAYSAVCSSQRQTGQDKGRWSSVSCPSEPRSRVKVEVDVLGSRP